jgi:hypothetical protein
MDKNLIELYEFSIIRTIFGTKLIRIIGILLYYAEFVMKEINTSRISNSIWTAPTCESCSTTVKQSGPETNKPNKTRQMT